MAMKLRTPDDVRRLFSALGDDLRHDKYGLSVAEVDEMALSASLEQTDWPSVGLSILVAMTTAWSAIRGYERNAENLLWGMGWGVLGFMFPVPAVAYTAYSEARAA